MKKNDYFIQDKPKSDFRRMPKFEEPKFKDVLKKDDLTKGAKRGLRYGGLGGAERALRTSRLKINEEGELEVRSRLEQAKLQTKMITEAIYKEFQTELAKRGLKAGEEWASPRLANWLVKRGYEDLGEKIGEQGISNFARDFVKNKIFGRGVEQGAEEAGKEGVKKGIEEGTKGAGTKAGTALADRAFEKGVGEGAKALGETAGGAAAGSTTGPVGAILGLGGALMSAEGDAMAAKGEGLEKLAGQALSAGGKAASATGSAISLAGIISFLIDNPVGWAILIALGAFVILLIFVFVTIPILIGLLSALDLIK